LPKSRHRGKRGSKGVITKHVNQLRERVESRAAPKPEKLAGFKPGFRYAIVEEMARKFETYIAAMLPGITMTVDRSLGSRFVAYRAGGGERWSLWLTDGRRADVTISKNLGDIEEVNFASEPDADRPAPFR